MTITLAPRPTIRRAALGDRTNSHVNVSLNNKGNENPATLPVKPQRPIIQVVTGETTTTVTTAANETAPSSASKDKTVVVEQDEDTQQPTKMKRVDVFSGSTWDDVTSGTNKDNNMDDRRASIVSPAYSEEGFGGDEDIADVEEKAPPKHPTSFDATGVTTTTTSETADHTKVVSKGHVFSAAFLEKSAREVLRPLEGESIQDAIDNMRAICIKAMANSGENWKAIVEDQDKYNLLSSSPCNDKIKSNIVYKALYVLGVVDVVSDTVSKKLPPTVIKSCELGRSKALEWIGSKRTEGLWVPSSNTIYQWYRDFCSGRTFKHPERAMHIQMRSLERLDDYFSERPVQKQTFKAHVHSVLKQQRVLESASGDIPASAMGRDGTLEGNAYDFYCYFVNDILHNSSDKASAAKRDAIERENEASHEAYAELLAEKQDHLAAFGFERLTWQHLSIWMVQNWAQSRNISWSL